jgi:hypothetical protein
VSYLWNTGHRETSVTISSEGVYSLTAIYENGCVSKDSVSVVAKDAPILNLGKTRLLCDTLPVDFNLIMESGAREIRWTLPDGSQNYDYLLSSSQAGMHHVFVEYSNGCKATDSVDIQRGNTGLVADFLLASAIKLGDSVKLVNLSQPKDLQYQWEISNGFVSREESPYFQIFRDGEFDVRLTVSDGSFCPATMRKIICVSTSGLRLPKGDWLQPENAQDSTIPADYFTGFLETKLYPNPNQGDFTVNVKLASKANIHALFADQSGRILVQCTWRGQSSYELDYRFGHLQSGVYVLKLISGLESRDFKIIIVK